MTVLPETPAMKPCLTCDHARIKRHGINCLLKGILIHSARQIDYCAQHTPRDEKHRKEDPHEMR